MLCAAHGVFKSDNRHLQALCALQIFRVSGEPSISLPPYNRERILEGCRFGSEGEAVGRAWRGLGLGDRGSNRYRIDFNQMVGESHPFIVINSQILLPPAPFDIKRHSGRKGCVWDPGAQQEAVRKINVVEYRKVREVERSFSGAEVHLDTAFRNLGRPGNSLFVTPFVSVNLSEG